MEETVNIKQLFQTLKKRLWLIVLVPIIVAICTAIVNFFILTPIYEAKTQLLVNQAKSEQQFYNSGEVQTNIQLINTYSVIIKSPKVLEQVKENLHLKRTLEDLDEQVTVTSAKDSQVVEVAVRDQSPKAGAKIANEIAKVFQKEVLSVMNVDNVSVLSPAVVKSEMKPIKPEPLINIIIALIISFILSIGLALLLEYLDNTIKTEEDVEDLLKLPVVGVITAISDVPKASNSREMASRQQRTRGETFGS